MAVAFGLDWFWQIVGMGSIFFGFAGIAIAGRCAQQAPAGARRDPKRDGAGP